MVLGQFCLMGDISAKEAHSAPPVLSKLHLKLQENA